MANIVFVPTCSKCRGLLFNMEIGVIREYLDDIYNIKDLYKSGYTTVYPQKCPHCGEKFKHILINDPELLNGRLTTVPESIMNYGGDEDV